jgi:hypothetical protein
MVENNGLIPKHQFSFRQRHSTIEQTHQIVRINEALENKQYCSAAFLDISQAFDTVWHMGLLYKLKLSHPLNYFLILTSYLHSRHFLVKVKLSMQKSHQSMQVHLKCPRAIIIPTIQSRPTNLTRIHSNLCLQYCSTSHGQCSSHCFTKTANQPSCNPQSNTGLKMENKS